MIILTNDDGIGAPGLVALEVAVSRLGLPYAIVAPLHQHSGCGHQVTTDRAISVESRGPHQWAIDGTPADCTRLALSQLYPESRWVFSGINAGGNLGSDVYLSGTVAAVREAAMHRIGGVALSHYRNGLQPYDWVRAASWASILLSEIISTSIEPGAYWNINLPHLLDTAPDPAVVDCLACTQPLPVEFKFEATDQGDRYHYCGKYSDRQRDADSDVAICLAGQIAKVKLLL